MLGTCVKVYTMPNKPFNGESESVSERQLVGWLLQRIPAISDRYAVEVEKQYGRAISEDHVNAYFVLSYVLKPHIEELLKDRNEEELQLIFNLLEHLANFGDPSVQNELHVTMEEVDAWKVWKYLGETMRQHEFERVTWFPEWMDRNTRQNTHVDKARYQQRWREEIERIDGLENLNMANELFIRYNLVREFGISGIRAPEPGGEEWLAMGLPWPWPPENQAA